MQHQDDHPAKFRRLALALFGALALSACSPGDHNSSAVALGGAQGKAGAQLAYEHELTLSLPAAQIGPRLAQTREACEKAQFGPCNILRLEQGKYRAQVTLRIVPDGVEPIVQQASQGAELGERITSAEDLADAVADVQRQQQRLKAQQQRLDELAARKDISVSDLIALSREQAGIENDLQALAQTAAGQQRRLDTNLLTLKFLPSDGVQRESSLKRAFSNLLDNLADGTAEALEKGSYVLPFVILAFPLVLLWVWLWRKFVRRRP
ncbi:hypothetical protein BS643_17395 [Pseudomonas protegens]|uniref:DUF4349 domain-containing protein n=1 Tax=Pseudomonas TaxID=286 RepID=UPI000806FC83|nr:DUF4349 domain-containing protein [Pseudomonas protegens]OBZ26536.1 hypothetical protein BBH58_14065 [Pseudomonas protegens]OBZ29426.1 hypothetical protein BBH57_05915 [Pseudomonas protegens]OKK42069.1 hypothetical protein BS643_17395 [Pseudomonas protegens]OKK48617.1 hypothetical protein BS644_14700 [Pseudomonas protegens]OKK53384.1 hypothetical protein BS645_26350 [Pseudomonas protegens]